MNQRMMQDFCASLSDLLSDSARLAEAKEEIERLRADAMRYRWMKSNHLQTGPDSWIRNGDDLEEAIDAAMKETPNVK